MKGHSEGSHFVTGESQDVDLDLALARMSDTSPRELSTDEPWQGLAQCQNQNQT